MKYRTLKNKETLWQYAEQLKTFVQLLLKKKRGKAQDRIQIKSWRWSVIFCKLLTKILKHPGECTATTMTFYKKTIRKKSESKIKSERKFPVC